MNGTIVSHRESAMTDSCEYRARLGVYHDGELSQEARADVEAHLRDCADCRTALHEMKEMSALFAAAEVEAAPPEAIAGMHSAVRAAQVEAAEAPSFLRPLAVIAASLLVISSVWLVDLSNRHPPARTPAKIVSVPAWERVAMTLHADPAIESDPLMNDSELAEARLTNWMVESLTRSP